MSHINTHCDMFLHYDKHGHYEYKKYHAINYSACPVSINLWLKIVHQQKQPLTIRVMAIASKEDVRHKATPGTLIIIRYFINHFRAGLGMISPKNSKCTQLNQNVHMDFL